MRNPRTRMGFLAAAGAGLCLAFAVLAAEIVVCDKCGREFRDDAAKCAHCGAPRPGMEAQTNAPPAAPQKGGPLAAGLVEDELRQADAQYAAKDFGVARLFCRNAMAINTLTADAGAGRTQRIVDTLARCEKSEGMGVGVCPTCKGAGRKEKTVALPGFSGTSGVQKSVESLCDECFGSGRMQMRLSVDQMKYERGRALVRYADAQRSRRFAQAGNAWLPRECVEQLSLRQTAALRRALAAPCAGCMGLGLVDCARCKGTGRVPCTNRQCSNGVVAQSETTGISGKRLAVRRTCPTCGGKSWVACTDCGGKRTRSCSACGGTGLPPVCERCGGECLAACTKCAGKGVVGKEPCPACNGEGSRLCAACGGDGHARR